MKAPPIPLQPIQEFASWCGTTSYDFVLIKCRVYFQCGHSSLFVTSWRTRGTDLERWSKHQGGLLGYK